MIPLFAGAVIGDGSFLLSVGSAVVDRFSDGCASVDAFSPDVPQADEHGICGKSGLGRAVARFIP